MVRCRIRDHRRFFSVMAAFWGSIRSIWERSRLRSFFIFSLSHWLLVVVLSLRQYSGWISSGTRERKSVLCAFASLREPFFLCHAKTQRRKGAKRAKGLKPRGTAQSVFSVVVGPIHSGALRQARVPDWLHTTASIYTAPLVALAVAFF